MGGFAAVLGGSLSSWSMWSDLLPTPLGQDSAHSMQSHCGTRFLCGKCEPIIHELTVSGGISVLQSTSRCSFKVNKFPAAIDQALLRHTVAESFQHALYTISGSSPASSLPSWSSPWPHYRRSHPGQKHSRSCSRHHDRTEDGVSQANCHHGP